MKELAWIGLGRLGLTCAATMAQAHRVRGYDKELRPERGALRVLPTLREAMDGAEYIFVSVQTPHGHAYGGETPAAGLRPMNFDYKHVKNVLNAIAEFAEPGQTVVLVSTVLPGTCRHEFAHLLPEGVRLVYHPYLIAMGSIDYDMVYPDLLIIGTRDGMKTNDVAGLYEGIIRGQWPHVVSGTWEEAECTKIFYNTMISARIATINMMMDVAERIGNCDVGVVTEALKRAEKRITSSAYMTPGMGDGGACHPRDNIALRWLAADLHLDYDLFGAIVHARDQQARNLARKLMNLSFASGLPIVIVGKSYKPNVPFTDGSYSLLIAAILKEYGIEVEWHDEETGDVRTRDGAAVFLISHETFDFKDLPHGLIIDGSIVLDPWRSLMNVPKGIELVEYGNTRRRSTHAG